MSTKHMRIFSYLKEYSTFMHQMRIGSEPVKDMLPRRSNTKMATPKAYPRGSVVDYTMRFARPHDGQCEVNLWKGGQVLRLQTPVPCGGGLQRQGYSFTLPPNTPTCTAADNCFLQFYYYSAESRDYASCTDIVISGTGPAAETGLVSGKMFNDGVDYALSNDQSNQYRGQQTTLPELEAKFQLEECTGKGSLVNYKTNTFEQRANTIRQSMHEAVRELSRTIV